MASAAYRYVPHPQPREEYYRPQRELVRVVYHSPSPPARYPRHVIPLTIPAADYDMLMRRRFGSHDCHCNNDQGRASSQHRRYDEQRRPASTPGPKRWVGHQRWRLASAEATDKGWATARELYEHSDCWDGATTSWHSAVDRRARARHHGTYDHHVDPGHVRQLAAVSPEEAACEEIKPRQLLCSASSTRSSSLSLRTSHSALRASHSALQSPRSTTPNWSQVGPPLRRMLGPSVASTARGSSSRGTAMGGAASLRERRQEAQERCYELGIASHGTVRQLEERLDAHQSGRDRAPNELRGRGHNW